MVTNKIHVFSLKQSPLYFKAKSNLKECYEEMFLCVNVCLCHALCRLYIILTYSCKRIENFDSISRFVLLKLHCFAPYFSVNIYVILLKHQNLFKIKFGLIPLKFEYNLPSQQFWLSTSRYFYFLDLWSHSLQRALWKFTIRQDNHLREQVRKIPTVTSWSQYILSFLAFPFILLWKTFETKAL